MHIRTEAEKALLLAALAFCEEGDIPANYNAAYVCDLVRTFLASTLEAYNYISTERARGAIDPMALVSLVRIFVDVRPRVNDLSNGELLTLIALDLINAG